jgi:hypothetical protein
VSALLLSLSTMLRMELPHINVLSKIDLIENYVGLGTEASFFEFEHFASHGIRCILLLID